MTEAKKTAPAIRAVHHHAFRTKDMETTRKFYEEILGLPMIGTFVETVDPVTEGPSNYIHTFFELGDGSKLAFFQFQEGMYKDSDIAGPQDPFDHHIALTVDSKDEVFAFKDRLESNGYECMLIDHGYCYSVYFHDPNGMQVELTCDVAETDSIMSKHRASAHEDLDKWLEGVYEANNEYRRLRDQEA